MEGLLIGAAVIIAITAFPVTKYFRERFVWNKGKCALCGESWNRHSEADFEVKFQAYKCKCSTAFFTFPVAWLGKKIREQI